VTAMLDLHDREWKEFRICDIFIIKAGKRLTKSDMTSGNKPFIGATDNNNGITEFVSNTNVSEDCNVLGVNYNGSVVENFYHPYTCIFSDDVKRFQTKQVQGNKYIYLFMKTVILQQKCKYAYGYKFNEKRMQKQSLLLPVDESGNPDYAFMEQYIKERERQIVQNYIDYIGSEHSFPTRRSSDLVIYMTLNEYRGKRLMLVLPRSIMVSAILSITPMTHWKQIVFPLIVMGL